MMATDNQKVNFVNLEVKPNKTYAEVVFFGDVHIGSRFSLIDRAQAMIDYCVDHHIYLMCMGDMMEAATRYSVGAGVYEQINPDEQIDKVIAMLGDAAKKKLILGYLMGNHEFRIMKETGIDVSRIICRELDIPYLGFSGWQLWRVGEQNYTVYTLHGSTSARFAQTKLKAVIDVALYFNADIVAHAHTHDIVIHAFLKEELDRKTQILNQRKSYVIITGHYLDYCGSYAQMKGYAPGKIGSPKIKLFGDRFDIHPSS